MSRFDYNQFQVIKEAIEAELCFVLPDELWEQWGHLMLMDMIDYNEVDIDILYTRIRDLSELSWKWFGRVLLIGDD